MTKALNHIVFYIKSYWLLALAVLVALAFNLVFFGGVRSAHREFSQKNEELNWLSAKRVNLLQLSRQQEKIRPTQEKLGRSFVARDNLVDFIEYLENTARDSGAALEIGAVSNGSDGSQRFRVGIAGSYSGFINFLARLENSQYLTRPVKIDISRTIDPETKSTTLKSNIDLIILSL